MPVIIMRDITAIGLRIFRNEKRASVSTLDKVQGPFFQVCLEAEKDAAERARTVPLHPLLY